MIKVICCFALKPVLFCFFWGRTSSTLRDVCGERLQMITAQQLLSFGRTKWVQTQMVVFELLQEMSAVTILLFKALVRGSSTHPTALLEPNCAIATCWRGSVVSFGYFSSICLFLGAKWERLRLYMPSASPQPSVDSYYGEKNNEPFSSNDTRWFDK